MYNIMVEAGAEKDELEDGRMYNIVNGRAVDTETEPGDDGDDNIMHSGDCLVMEQSMEAIGTKVLSVIWYTCIEKLYMILRIWVR
jgi:hypothetical protein